MTVFIIKYSLKKTVYPTIFLTLVVAIMTVSGFNFAYAGSDCPIGYELKPQGDLLTCQFVECPEGYELAAFGDRLTCQRSEHSDRAGGWNVSEDRPFRTK